MFDIDTRSLIALVQSKDALWNIFHESYRTRKNVKSWQQIAKAMVFNYTKLPPNKQRDIVHQIKSKWKTLRVSYKNVLKNELEFSCEPIKFKYKKEMTFLRETILASSLLPTNVNNDENDDNDDDWEIEGTRATAEKRTRICEIENKIPAVQSKNPVPSYKSYTSSYAPKTNHDFDMDLQKKTINFARQDHCVKEEVASKHRRTVPQNSLMPKIVSYTSHALPGNRKKVVYSLPRDPSELKSSYYNYCQSFENESGFKNPIAKRSLADDENVGNSCKYAKRMDDVPRHENASERATTSLICDRNFKYFQPAAYLSDSPVTSEYYDEDMAFFRSLQTWTKDFNEERKMEFRMEMMKLIQQIRKSERNDSFHMLSRVTIQQL